MKILNARQIKEVDVCTIQQQNITSLDLMERAATAFVNKIIGKLNKEKKIHIYCGKGNNGGDGLVTARLMAQRGYAVWVYIIEHTFKASDDFSVNYKKLVEATESPVILHIENIGQLKSIEYSDEIYCIDAVLGSGINKSTHGIIKDVIDFINNHYAHIISIDVPSGLFLDHLNGLNDSIIKATHTYTFQLPKFSFFIPENAQYIGQWEILDIGLSDMCIQKQSTNFYVIDKEMVSIRYKPRQKIGAKWDYGHCLIIAGSENMRGAAVLCVGGALRSGCGLVSIHSIEKVINDVIQKYPECILSTDKNAQYVQTLPDLNKYTAIAFGCGIGKNNLSYQVLEGLIKNSNGKKIIIDADGLNLLAEQRAYELLKQKNIIITPHIKEFDRLFGNSVHHFERINKAIQIAKQLQLVIVLKSAYTAVVLPSGNVYFNSLANSALAKGGSGDVLTGIIASLCARGYPIEDAAIIGVYIHSLAGKYTTQHIHPESVLPSDIINHISHAYMHINNEY